MSELEDKLNSLLSNQDAMAQVMQLAQSLSQSGAGGAADSGSAASPPPPQSGAAAGNAMPSAGDLNAMLSQLTGGLDPALLSRLLPVLSQMNRNESSETSALLYALQPFLRDKRRDKVARSPPARHHHVTRRHSCAMRRHVHLVPHQCKALRTNRSAIQ